VSKEAIKLTQSTLAIAVSKEAVHLLEQKERLEDAAIKGDFPLCLDMSKAFLESIFKTILNDRVSEAELPNNFPRLFRSIRDNIQLNTDDDVNNKIYRLAGSIINVVNELRNDYGAASHGDDGYHESPIDEDCSNFIISSVDGLASLVYRKHKNSLIPYEVERFNYNDFQEFNDWADEQYEPYIIPIDGTEVVYSASEVLFSKDIEAYKEMMVQYYQGIEE